VKHWIQMFVCAVSLGAAASAQASLQARDLDGDTMTDAYYDTELNITWLRDWNMGAGSSYDNGSSTTDGRMTWFNARDWADNLSFGGYTDWRLPTMVDTGAGGCPTVSFGGGTDCGYNVQTKSGSTVYSEMAHLYYETLGAEGWCLAGDAACGVFGLAAGWTSDPQADFEADHGDRPFLNMQTDVPYWSGLVSPSFASGGAWWFYLSTGLQNLISQDEQYYAVAVRPGDVAAPVPEPTTLALALLAMGATVVARRRRPSSVYDHPASTASDRCQGSAVIRGCRP